MVMDFQVYPAQVRASGSASSAAATTGVPFGAPGVTNCPPVMCCCPLARVRAQFTVVSGRNTSTLIEVITEPKLKEVKLLESIKAQYPIDVAEGNEALTKE